MRERTKFQLEGLTSIAGACAVNGSVRVAPTSRRHAMSYLDCAPIRDRVARPLILLNAVPVLPSFQIIDDDL